MKITINEVRNGYTVLVYDSEEHTGMYVAHDYKEVVEILSKLINKG